MTTYEAVLDDEVIARSDRTVLLEGNHYFPTASVRSDVLQPSPTRTICPWKGRASYFVAEVGGRRFEDVAWTYRHPSPLARQIREHVAFAAPVQVRTAP